MEQNHLLLLTGHVIPPGLPVPSESEGLQDDGPADGAGLEVRSTAVAHAGVPTGQQHHADRGALTHHAVSAAPL